ncbi:exodeoxyribonuclease I [Ignatzschineria larvae DSM 13226]|uniref:Exodeoxyribonuclease I n=1 Tax=Ignatzschineria larvae DSM 13226 TaxID=1111732 RepID=A0ABZ3C182_9GAMM|nr:exodeoxyribonuclease I [Ignatzschineria larvae]
MTATFFFYDLETFGLNPKEDRIAQFAGVRTDRDFNIIGEPINLYCQPPEEYIPDPESILVTGITPQEAMEKGLPEAEFARQIHALFSEPNTCILGYNNIRFDDEMIRYLFYRNFIDPYAYTWQNGNSRWDLLDVVRATYAFRPEGIEWPQNKDGTVSLRLEHLSKANNLQHEKAHDALSDVYATIGMAQLISQKQPKLFNYYFEHRKARDLQPLIDFERLTPLLHVSGMFGYARDYYSLIMPLFFHPQNKNQLITIDLMGDIEPLLTLDSQTIAKRMYKPSSELLEGESRIPLKGIYLNRAPILAPASILKTLPNPKLDEAYCVENYQRILSKRTLLQNKLFEIYQAPSPFETENQDSPVESLLYHGFFEAQDRHKMAKIPTMNGVALRDFEFNFHDPRLEPLLFIYRARNFFATLYTDEQTQWQNYVRLKRTYFINEYQAKFNTLLQEAETAGNEQQIALLRSLLPLYQSQ